MNAYTRIAADLAAASLSPREIMATASKLAPYAEALNAMEKLPPSALFNAIRAVMNDYSGYVGFDDIDRGLDLIADEIRAENQGGADVADLAVRL